MFNKIKEALLERGTHHIIQRKYLKLTVHTYPINTLGAVSGEIGFFQFTYKCRDKYVWQFPEFAKMVWVDPAETQLVMRTNRFNCSINIPHAFL